ncbi:MAG TPA: hypothetical protein VII56_13260 [Rhizomicrobium sp.]
MTMLTVVSQGVAELEIKNISLQPLLGAYELSLGLIGKALNNVSELYWFTLTGAHVSLSSVAGIKKRLGIATAGQIFRTHAGGYGAHVSVEFKLTLQPHQITAMEDLCHDQDMTFELSVIGEGGGGPQGRSHLYETFSKMVPRSAWVEQLRSAAALDILLFEVPMPVSDPPPEQRAMIGSLRRAQKMFLEGNYPECVQRCRDVMDAIEADPVLANKHIETMKKLITSEDRRNMTREEREFVIISAVRNYTHLAHHPGDPEGPGYFTRNEAKQALTLSAALVARAFTS